VRYWRGYLSGLRCKWFPYGPADAAATLSSLAPFWCQLTQLVLGKKADNQSTNQVYCRQHDAWKDRQTHKLTNIHRHTHTHTRTHSKHTTNGKVQITTYHTKLLYNGIITCRPQNINLAEQYWQQVLHSSPGRSKENKTISISKQVNHLVTYHTTNSRHNNWTDQVSNLPSEQVRWQYTPDADHY